MNENMTRIDAKNLTAGQDFIYNYAGGNRTVYRAVRVSSGGGRTVISYTIPGDETYSKRVSEFYTAGLSTLFLIGN